MTTTTSLSTTAAASARLPLRALLTLSLGVLVTVTAESLPAGLLPEMSADLGASPSQIGLMISVWALTVIVTSIPLARGFARVDRRLVVGVALAAFALATAATALAPSYAIALALRVASAAAHGLFWAVVIVYATALLAPTQLARGLAIVTAGGTAATVVGLPAATLVAQVIGWRASFVVLGAIALALGAVVVRTMPSYRPAPPARASRGGGLSRDRSLPILMVFGLAGVLIAVAHFAAFTYIRPYLEISASIDAQWAPALLFVYGIAGLGGVWIAGALGDRYPRAGFAAVLVVMLAAFTVLTFASGTVAVVIGALVVWGFANGAMFPLLQTTLMRVATERTRTFASAGIIVLFNVGIAIGPWLGGIVGGETSPTVTTAVAASAMLIASIVGIVGVALAGRRLALEDGNAGR